MRLPLRRLAIRAALPEGPSPGRRRALVAALVAVMAVSLAGPASGATGTCGAGCSGTAWPPMSAGRGRPGDTPISTGGCKPTRLGQADAAATVRHGAAWQALGPVLIGRRRNRSAPARDA